MLKAVLMDIDDTLHDFGKCAEQACASALPSAASPSTIPPTRCSRASTMCSGSRSSAASSPRSSFLSSAGTASSKPSALRPTASRSKNGFWTFSMRRPSPSTARTRSAAISRESTFSARRATPSTTSSSTASLCRAFSPTLTMYLFRSRSATASPRRRFSTLAALFFPMLPRTNAS